MAGSPKRGHAAQTVCDSRRDGTNSISKDMNPNTQLAAPTSLKGLINSDNMRKQFALALPRHLSADRFVRICTTALMRVKNLDQCTPESLMKCLLDLSSYGIEPDGRRAHLIPFKNNKAGTYECTLILDWKGLAELALRSGMIAKLHADLICENDDFAFDMGEILHHRINFRQDRGEPYAAYAMAVTKTGEKFVQVMTRSQIERIRDNSQGYKSAMKYGGDSPWTTDPGEMWKKTAFRRLAKWLPLSPEFRDAVEKDDDEMITHQVREIPPAKVPLFTPVADNNTASETAAATELGGSGADGMSASPGGVSRTRQSKQKAAEPEPQNTDTSTEFLAAMTAANVAWEQVAAAAARGGIQFDAHAPLDEQPNDLLKALLSNWEGILKMIGGVK